MLIFIKLVFANNFPLKFVLLQITIFSLTHSLLNVLMLYNENNRIFFKAAFVDGVRVFY